MRESTRRAVAAAIALALAGCAPADDDGRKTAAASPAAPSASVANGRTGPPLDAVRFPTAPDVQPARAAPSITLEAPATVHIGTPYELVVHVDGADVGEVDLTVQLDPNILQARAASRGDWIAGAGTDGRFDGTVSNAGDRVQLRGTVAGRRGGTGGVVAIVEFEAVGRGTTAVTVANLTMRDRSRNALSGGAMPRLQLTAE